MRIVSACGLVVHPILQGKSSLKIRCPWPQIDVNVYLPYCGNVLPEKTTEAEPMKFAKFIAATIGLRLHSESSSSCKRVSLMQKVCLVLHNTVHTDK